MTSPTPPISVDRLLDSDALRPLVPLLHFAWSDGRLSTGEAAAFRAPLLGMPGLDEEVRTELAGWLDDRNPPTAAELGRLEDAVLELLGDTIPPTLTAFARALADPGSPWAGEAGEVALSRAEHGLGLIGGEALRDLVDRRADAPDGAPVRRRHPTSEGDPPFDVDRLREHLALPHADLRRRVLDLLATEPFRFDPETPRPERRERTLEAIRILAREGLGSLAYPAEYGGADSPARSVAAFETLAFGDMSVVVKYGVQFGLWGGSVYQLGTRSHHERWLPAIVRAELPGCFAMTEISHGSNVRDLETIARWDPESGDFVLHTPHEAAGKEWIGNAALHGRAATVFAQLHVDGKSHGIHALVVPLRDEAGRPLPGIRIEDDGAKEGLNGVDNGRIWFDRVRVPRENLLDRFASVDENGVYTSEIPSSGRRFFTMLGTLVGGRISIAAASVSAAKTALTIAIRYSDRRHQFGPSGRPEIPILDFTTQQRLLLPRLAETWALHHASRGLVDRYDRHLRAGSPEGAGNEIEAEAAALKARASRHAIDTLQAARESMGGRGYRADNRIGQLKADVDIFATFEGANVALQQLAAKSLLLRYRDQVGDLRLWDMVRYIADRAGSRVRDLDPVTPRKTDPAHLRDPEMHAAAFQWREERLLHSVARRMKSLIDDGIDSFDALNVCQDHMVSLAEAWTDRILFEAFRDGVARAPTPAISETLDTLCTLFALSRLEADRGWFLEAGWFEPAKSKAIRTEVNRLCGEIREIAVPLVDAWGIPDDVLQAPDGLSGDGTGPGPA